MKFNIGDSVIYPTHGLAQVEAIEERFILGKKDNVYTLRLLNKNLTVIIPTSNAQKIGIRNVIESDAVPEVLNILSKHPQPNKSSYWHHRYNDNQIKVKSGSIFQIAEVVRDLAALKNTKKLAVKETRMMDNAKQLVVTEIAHSSQMPLETAEDQVNKAILKALTKLKKAKKIQYN